MRRARHDMGVFERVIQQTGCDESSRVSHIDHEDRADLIGYLADTGIIPFTAVRTRACDNQFRLVLARLTLQVLIIDTTCRFVQVITDRIEHQTAEIDGRTVTQVTAMTQVETHERVAGFEASHENGHVRLRTRVRLYVHVLRVVQLFQTLPRDILRDIHHFAAAVIAMTGITLCVLVGQHATHRLHHLVTHEILTGN